MAAVTAATVAMAPVMAAPVAMATAVATAGRFAAAAAAEVEQVERKSLGGDTHQAGSQRRHKSTILHGRAPQKRNNTETETETTCRRNRRPRDVHV
jgi:hypothetical protein